MLTTEIDAHGFAIVTLDMADRSMNVLDWNAGKALDQTFENLLGDDTVKAIIITSAKPTFIAGADLAIMADFQAPDETPGSAAQRIAPLGDMMRRLETGGKPVVAAAPGTALGGGLELMLACHYRIAADDPKAAFGLPEVKLGLLPGAGGTQRLPRMIGIAEALPLLLSGKSLSATEALRAGILDEVVPEHALLDAARAALKDGRVSPVVPWDQKGFAPPGPAPQSLEVGNLFAMKNASVLAKTQGNYPAPKAILSCVYEGTRLPMDKALKVEREYFATLVMAEVPHAMIRTLFFGRLAAEKAGRTPGDPASAFVKAGRAAYIAEGLAMLREGTPEVLIENAALSFGMARGPIALAREAGHDLAAGPSDNAPPDVADVQDRLISAQVRAATEARGDVDPAIADLDAIIGWGFPAWTGGPLALQENALARGEASQLVRGAPA
ncbi:MAG: enoyl-CoA hydratase-related protein [Pseudomonadota bacterium]